MQRFLRKREAQVLAVVTGELPLPENYQRKTTKECKMPSERGSLEKHRFLKKIVSEWGEVSYVRSVTIRQKEKSSEIGIATISRLPDGTKHGPFHAIRENGAMRNVFFGNYRMDKKHGIFQKIFQTGEENTSKFLEVWNDGVLLFSRMKTQYLSETFRYTSSESGVYRYFLEGNLFCKYEIKDSLLHGVCDLYFDGFGKGYKLKTRTVYENGVEKKKTRYYSTGRVKQIIHYKNGRLHGIRETFSPEGVTTRREIFENGKFVHVQRK
ncbi:MORN repeat-containing protein [Noumeavirus]|uniref:MORN repeat-containing protein n=1 Tax=Noumeavirus TaxID=1955558 RepID=UPI000982E032|nr:MORN repeat-containing protein [Noumeavirus]AQM73313.1 MORN repeat-containing protein [Noumeavirus]